MEPGAEPVMNLRLVEKRKVLIELDGWDRTSY